MFYLCYQYHKTVSVLTKHEWSHDAHTIEFFLAILLPFDTGKHIYSILVLFSF